MIDLGLARLTALELAPAALVPEAARAGFSFVGLRVIPATADGAAYPTRVGTDAHRTLKQLLATEGVRLNEIEFVQLTPHVDIPVLATLLGRRGRGSPRRIAPPSACSIVSRGER
jgi:hypothetical protein